MKQTLTDKRSILNYFIPQSRPLEVRRDERKTGGLSCARDRMKITTRKVIIVAVIVLNFLFHIPYQALPADTLCLWPLLHLNSQSTL